MHEDSFPARQRFSAARLHRAPHRERPPWFSAGDLSYSPPLPRHVDTRVPAASRSPEDDDLVQRSIAGSRDAFGLLVLRHARMVRAICMARIGSRDVEDAVQEVLLRAFRGLPRLQATGSFVAYLGQIARNHCIDRLRTTPKQKPVSLDEVELDPPDPRQPDAADELRAERLDRLRKEIGRLPESQRECLLLFYFEEMSYAQMAESLGLTEAAVNQRLSRARQHLRSVLTTRREGEAS